MSQVHTPVAACMTVAEFLAILKDQATHTLAMPDASPRAYRAFAAVLDSTMALCGIDAPTLDDCAEIEEFLGYVAIAVLDGKLFPDAPRLWKQAFLDAIEYAGIACAQVTGSLKGQEPENSLTVH